MDIETAEHCMKLLTDLSEEYRLAAIAQQIDNTGQCKALAIAVARIRAQINFIEQEKTFKKLQKTDFNKLSEIINTMPAEKYKKLLDSSELRREYLASHGWTLEEFRVATEATINRG